MVPLYDPCTESSPIQASSIPLVSGIVRSPKRGCQLVGNTIRTLLEWVRKVYVILYWRFISRCQHGQMGVSLTMTAWFLYILTAFLVGSEATFKGLFLCGWIYFGFSYNAPYSNVLWHGSTTVANPRKSCTILSMSRDLICFLFVRHGPVTDKSWIDRYGY